MRTLLIALGLAAALSVPALAAPEEEAVDAPDARFLGTGSRTVVTDAAGIRDYFERAFLTDRPRGARLLSHSTRVLTDGSVVISGLDETTATRDGKTISNPGRTTFVIAKRAAEWKIVHFHRSGVPGGPAK